MIKKAAILFFVICALTSCSQKHAAQDGHQQEKEGTEFFSPFKLF